MCVDFCCFSSVWYSLSLSLTVWLGGGEMREIATIYVCAENEILSKWTKESERIDMRASVCVCAFAYTFTLQNIFYVCCLPWAFVVDLSFQHVLHCRVDRVRCIYCCRSDLRTRMWERKRLAASYCSGLGHIQCGDEYGWRINWAAAKYRMKCTLHNQFDNTHTRHKWSPCAHCAVQINMYVIEKIQLNQSFWVHSRATHSTTMIKMCVIICPSECTICHTKQKHRMWATLSVVCWSAPTLIRARQYWNTI